MATPLLRTKLYIPPTRPELVPRPRLIERLNAGLHRKLTLISAPAGFGKTTLLSEWINQSPIPNTKSPKFAWLSLDEDDNDLARFLAYFVAALQTIDGNVGKGLLAALQSPGPVNVEPVLTALLNEIADLSDNLVLVLDDYHVIESQPVDNALTFTLDHLPPQMHLVIATRTDPTLPLSRLRARGQLTELRAADLRFTTDEAAAFLQRVIRIPISPDDVCTLESCTEGWITGLQLAAVAMQGLEQPDQIAHFIHSFCGSHRYIIDYLVDEVLDQQTLEVQEFLLQTSILDRMVAPLCNVVASRKDSQAILERLEAANLFLIPLDSERRWYRYHHLFADLLRQRLHQTQPEQVPILHCQASEWCELNGFVDEAIDYALAAEDFERAADLVEGRAETLWGRGEQTKLLGWLEALPVEQVFSKPQLCIFRAWGLFASGQQGAAERSLQAAEQALDPTADRATETSPIERDQPPGSDRMKLQGRVAAIRAFMASFRGDVPGIIQYSRQALEYLPEQDSVWRSSAAIALGDAYSFKGELAAAYRARLEALKASKAAGNIYLILIASLKLAVTLRQQGRLQRTIEICQQQLQLVYESGLSQTAMAGWLLAIWGEVLAELNDLDGAIHQAKNGAELTGRGSDVAMLGWSCLCLVRVLFARGDMADAEEIIQKMENIAREYHVPPWITSPMAAWQARIWLAQDKLDSASHWVGERGLDADGDPTYLHEMEYMVLARILIAQGRLDEATSLLQRLLEATETGGRTSRAIEVLVLQALAVQAQGDTIQAITTLERALSLAEPGGYVRIFVDEGPPMARLLYEAVARGIMPDYTRKLLAAFEDATKDERRRTEPSPSSSVIRPSSPALSKAEGLVEPLSQRELEVLQLIAEGLSNREISERLFLALSTVKGHNRNIFGKLQVQRRTEAVARARELGLV
jgi:LuxR family maltose regulon positive regulatory protein